MKIQKLVAFGIAGAVLLLVGASGAANTNITSLTDVPAKIATDTEFSIDVNGTGKCDLKYEVIDANGKVTSSTTFHGFDYGLPTYASQITLKSPGVNKIVVTTIANQYTPNCAPGQKLEATVTAFQKPKCPPGWEKTYYDAYTGEISCVVVKPTLACKGNSEPFYSAGWPNECNAGCYTPAY